MSAEFAQLFDNNKFSSENNSSQFSGQHLLLLNYRAIQQTSYLHFTLVISVRFRPQCRGLLFRSKLRPSKSVSAAVVVLLRLLQVYLQKSSIFQTEPSQQLAWLSLKIMSTQWTVLCGNASTTIYDYETQAPVRKLSGLSRSARTSTQPSTRIVENRCYQRS